MSKGSSRHLPVVASFCATFLKPEMWHIYRQIVSLRQVRPIVIARKRENDFPFDPVYLVPKPASNFLRRIWYRQLRHVPWPISRGETRRLRSILERENAALLHIYFGHVAVELLPLIRTWPKPVVVSFHGADVGVDLSRESHRQATREMLSLVRRILVRSESIRRALLELGAPAEKIELQRTGIPREDFPFQPRTEPANEEWRLVQACRLIEKKGLATSLRAFRIFLDAHPNAHLIIAGEGPQLGELKALSKELRLDDAVTFSGFLPQEKLRRLFEQSHFFIHPSEIGGDQNQEGVPNSMLEAMASGLVVFATRHGGIPEAVEDGVSGRLVAERDAEGLARALIEVANSPTLLRKMSHRGSEVIAEGFDRAEQTRRLEQIYLNEL